MKLVFIVLLKVDPVEEELLHGGVVHVDVAGEDVKVGKYLRFMNLGTNLHHLF